MSDGTRRPARLITAFGTVLYVDAASGELRHGPAETSPGNALLVADPDPDGGFRRGRLTLDRDGAREPIVCAADGCRIASRAAAGGADPTLFEVVPLERGLLALRAGGFFLSAIPDGSARLSAAVCSTWELFLASEPWCAETADAGVATWESDPSFDRWRIKTYIVDPLIRATSNLDTGKSKLLVHGYTKWSQGRVYYDLCKQLFARSYIVDVLNWRVDHASSIKSLSRYYDLFLTTPDGVGTLIDAYGIPCSRIIVVSHSEFDIRMLIEQKGVDIFDQFAGYGVLSEPLFSASAFLRVKRAPAVVPLGVTYAEFYSELPRRLEAIGYAASMSLTIDDVEVKRGVLAEEVARETGLAFKVAGSGSTVQQIFFQAMPDFYRGVDCVLTTSTNEGAGLPALEAAAAGRLVISTPVGHVPSKALGGGIIVAPIEARKFRDFAVAKLLFYKKNPAAFVERCRLTQRAAEKFDWSYVIEDWVNLIESAAHAGQAAAPLGSKVHA